jgi:cellulose synthase/poly-beta-1,6-N-acetylglucosamine synthase-like glycosyltransferase
MPSTLSVVIATYRRPERLAECLSGLRAQARPPDEVIVVTRSTDGQTAQLVASLMPEWSELRCVQVDRRGLVAALNSGLGAARGDVVAFVDDDAVPADDWLERVATTFAEDDGIAAVGGRDAIERNGRILTNRPRGLCGRRSRSPEVGRIAWCGRMVGNHHLGSGAARNVDVLKGANMSFRRRHVIGHGFDERLLGSGTEVHSELSICLPLRRGGMRVIYDPAIIVWHYPAARQPGDERDTVDTEAIIAATHNEALSILDYFSPLRRLLFMAWGAVVGRNPAPGLVLLVRDVVAGRPGAWTRFQAGQRGRAAAWRTHRRTARSVPSALVGRTSTHPDADVSPEHLRRVSATGA